MAVTFTNVGGSESRFHDDATPVKLNNGLTVRADALSNGDTWLARRPGPGDIHWATIDSVPVVT